MSLFVFFLQLRFQICIGKCAAGHRFEADFYVKLDAESASKSVVWTYPYTAVMAKLQTSALIVNLTSSLFLSSLSQTSLRLPQKPQKWRSWPLKRVIWGQSGGEWYHCRGWLIYTRCREIYIYIYIHTKDTTYGPKELNLQSVANMKRIPDRYSLAAAS